MQNDNRGGRGTITAAVAAGVLALIGAGEVRQANAAGKPNILFIILDDVGIDQLKIFGNGGLLPPRTPEHQSDRQEWA